MAETFLKNLNPELPDPDYLYHLGLNSQQDRLDEVFADVGHVSMPGSGRRAFHFAKELVSTLGGSFRVMGKEPNQAMDTQAAADEALEAVKTGKKDFYDLTAEHQDQLAQELGFPRIVGKDERYWMFVAETPAGAVVSVNHHMGMPTHSILLHEMTKLLHHVGADRVERPFEFSRQGTSGGLGIEPGTVVVANRGLEPSGKAQYRLHVLGEERAFPTEFDPAMSQALFDCRDVLTVPVVRGDTVSCNDFYTEQARRDGAFNLTGSEEAKIAYLQRLHAQGARNMEMEAAGFAAFTQLMGIPAACVGTALLNRLHGDQVTSTHAQLASYSDGPQQLLIEHIKRGAGLSC